MRQFCVKSVLFAFLLSGGNLKAQQPILKIKGPDSADVSLTGLKTTVKVIGNYAITTMEMEFCNTGSRVLEGELNFPMPEGVSVSGYAIDINGKMREAVPVEKEKGQVVFENIERRNIDPGLLEKTEGNNFRTRIYPIPAKGCRHVMIGYEQLLTAKNDYSFIYSLPMHYRQPLRTFDFSITVGSNYIPEVGADCNTHLKFEELNKVFTSTVSKKDFTPDGDFTIIIPKTPDAAAISMQRANGQYAFLINTCPAAKTVKKEIPDVITLIWDASLSGQNRDHKKELELLDAYINAKKNITIHLYSIDIAFKKINTYTISNGNWDAMRKNLEAIVYDGATDFSAIKFLPPGEEYLVFTDGLNNFGNTDNMILPQKPVYTICAATTADYSLLKLVAAKTGGSFINLNETDSITAQKYLTEQPLQFLGIRPNNNITEVYPSIATPVVNNCTIAGISRSGNETITLLFGYGNKVAFEQTIKMDVGLHKTAFINIEKIWAQKKITELDMQYEKNSKELTALGQKYSIITRNTSLIVLDRAEDYVQYDITPPAELMPAYTKLMNEKKMNIAINKKGALAEAHKYIIDVEGWWKRDFKRSFAAKQQKPVSIYTEDPLPVQAAPVPYLRVTDTAVAALPATAVHHADSLGNMVDLLGNVPVMDTGFVSNGSASNLSVFASPVGQYDSLGKMGRAAGNIQVMDTDHDGVNDTIDKCIHEPGPASNFGCPVIAEAIIEKMEYASPSLRADREVVADRTPIASYNLSHTNDPVSIDIKKILPDKPYLNEISKTAKEGRYKKYLELRKENNYPAFYFDVAGLFFNDGDTITGYRVLSNIADLNLEDHELYKMMGYRLKAIEKYEDEAMIFKKVLQWRPQDPQSYRDYALALSDAGRYQQALDTLYLALTQNYDEQIKDLYPGIEEVIVTEINGLIALHGDKLNLSGIDKSLIKKMPVDVRVVLNWNMNDTDIDLWIIEPDGEKCFFQNTRTAIGGRISNDFTRGYGPEHYMLKKAVKGKYKVIIDYYGDTRQRLAGRTTVMAEIYTHYGTSLQQRKIIAMQMQDLGSGEVLVGEFSF